MEPRIGKPDLLLSVGHYYHSPYIASCMPVRVINSRVFFANCLFEPTESHLFAMSNGYRRRTHWLVVFLRSYSRASYATIPDVCTCLCHRLIHGFSGDLLLTESRTTRHSAPQKHNAHSFQESRHCRVKTAGNALGARSSCGWAWPMRRSRR